MPLKITDKTPSLFDVGDKRTTAPCVPLVRQEVAQWRAQDFPGITQTTRKLFNFWFKNEHRTADGATFKYYDVQREAIETLVYLYEVKKVRRQIDLLREFFKGTERIAFPQRDNFPRYAVKMATGSGKTKVMALAIVWQYLNAVLENPEEYAKTFLLVAPNLIVLDRLLTDFGAGRIFKKDPLIPREFALYWDFEVYAKGDSERGFADGALYVTNVHQLYERNEDAKQPANALEALLGNEPKDNLSKPDEFFERICQRGDCLVINDEAHHTNDKAVEWNNVCERLHTGMKTRGLSAQLDFSATPRQSDGSLFAWTVFDYSLYQAIVDNIVKRPIKGVARGIEEAKSELASVRYEAYLVAAVERWLEYKRELAALQKKPILFLMLDDTKNADDVAEWLRLKYPTHFDGEKLLVIHTKTKGADIGEIDKKDLETARQFAREVDAETSPVNAVVSVLVLREGWDVKNVTVVAGLRAFSSKANVLPEQAIGRGLRKMFGGLKDYKERVDIIGNANFMQVVEDLEKEEGIKLETFNYGKEKQPLKITTIAVDAARVKDFDIAIPRLTPRLVRHQDPQKIVSDFDVSKIRLPRPLSLDTTLEPPQEFVYEGRDILLDTVEFTREYKSPQINDANALIAFYTKHIAAQLKLPMQFAVLSQKIEQFLREKAFGKTVDLTNSAALQALNSNLVGHITTKVFLATLRPKLTENLEAMLDGDSQKLSQQPPMPWSGKITEARKTVFELTPCNNDFEIDFAEFLDNAGDVRTFANLGNLKYKLIIEYLDHEKNLRCYEPDFAAIDRENTHWVLETKGREDLDVEHKDRRAAQWCEDASLLTQTEWRYLKIPQKDFEILKPNNFAELVSSLTADQVFLFD